MFFFGSVACGLSHSMVIVDRTDVADRLEQLEIYDGKGSLEESVEPKEEAVATTKQKPAKRGASKKRKASKASSDSDEENSDKEKEAQGSDSDYSDDDGEEEANGKKQRTPRRGRGRGGRGRGGRTGNGKASPVEEEVDLASLRNHSDSKKESTWSIFQQFSSLSSHNEMLRKTFLITVSNICLSFTGLCILM
ncbi:histone deacetylase HDT2-like [Brassica napus]|uniref:histone deacetylase HDT2-like n=1 Tax=Brassica napus TaxID=3708 RepID=UPI002078C753|nr:histone deacetylase HDT2-like [Brassica napus]